ncbi:TlpA family protein disulfide reductase [Sphingomonas piscis]|uniref:TlpA family protein disulfide reductase n=1 Tax=Sphingomonas piscis TaxID=2714943 RepID=UPI001FE93236|nr:TlpA disulfide reductase family protein [Sphingomonas piscis]
MRLIVLLLAAAAVAGCDTQKASEQQGAEANASAAAQGVPAKGVDRSHKGASIPDAMLTDPDGDPGQLAELEGKPLLVNLWATWCGPCVKELPTLVALSKRGGDLNVIAVSQDMGERTTVDAWLTDKKLDGLEVWHDPKMSLAGALDVQVLPSTILYDATGKEVWRYTGELDWSGPEAAKLLAEATAAAKG